MFNVVVVSWNYSPCLCTARMPSLLVPQPFMSLRRQVTKQQREPYTSMFVLAVPEWTGLSIVLVHMYVGNPVRPSYGVQLWSATAFQCTQTDGEGEAFMTGCVWPFDSTPQSPPPPPPCPFHGLPLRASPAPFLHHSQALSSQTLEDDFFHRCHKDSCICLCSFVPRSGELRTQKLKSHLVRTQSLNVLPVKPGVGQYIAMHATLTARDFFLAYFYPSGPFADIFFSKTSPYFYCVGCG